MKTMSAALAAVLFLAVSARSAPSSEAAFAASLGAAQAQVAATLASQAVASAGPVASAAPGAPAAPTQPVESVVRDQVVLVGVPLNAKTVKCSRADYSMPMLKVLVPALADLTVLNHRNTREGAPCLAAGSCGERGPETILAGGEGVDRVPMRVTLKKVARVDANVCRVSLVETVKSTIRGVEFFHERGAALPDRDPADCR